MKRRLTWTAAGLAVGAVSWLPMTSVALCFFLRTLDVTSPWVLPFAAFFYWRDFDNALLVAHWLPLCAVAAGMVAAAPALCILSWPESGRLRAARPGEKAPPPRRALSDAHAAPTG